MQWSERVTMDPAICHGKPTLRGLRYPVEMLLELLSAGMSMEEILADYEDLERDDLLTALAFAAPINLKVPLRSNLIVSVHLFKFSYTSIRRYNYGVSHRRKGTDRD